MTRLRARNFRLRPLDTNCEFLSFGAWGFRDMLWRSPMEFGAKPQKYLAFWHLQGSRIDLKRTFFMEMSLANSSLTKKVTIYNNTSLVLQRNFFATIAFYLHVFRILIKCNKCNANTAHALHLFLTWKRKLHEVRRQPRSLCSFCLEGLDWRTRISF